MQGLNWIYKVHDTDKWLDLVQAVMNIRVP